MPTQEERDQLAAELRARAEELKTDAELAKRVREQAAQAVRDGIAKRNGQ